MLCGDPQFTKHSYDRHVARHLQELALFVLPRNDEDSDDGEHASTESKSSIATYADARGRIFAKCHINTEGEWTEITKDLVSEEAIKRMGYGYEETELFYYVMEHLRYVSTLLGTGNGPLSASIQDAYSP